MNVTDQYLKNRTSIQGLEVKITKLSKSLEHLKLKGENSTNHINKLKNISSNNSTELEKTQSRIDLLSQDKLEIRKEVESLSMKEKKYGNSKFIDQVINPKTLAFLKEHNSNFLGKILKKDGYLQVSQKKLPLLLEKINSLYIPELKVLDNNKRLLNTKIEDIGDLLQNNLYYKSKLDKNINTIETNRGRLKTLLTKLNKDNTSLQKSNLIDKAIILKPFKKESNKNLLEKKSFKNKPSL